MSGAGKAAAGVAAAEDGEVRCLVRYRWCSCLELGSWAC